MEEAEIKTTTRPSQLLHYLAKINVHLFSFTAQLSRLKVMQRRLITRNVHEGYYFFVWFVYTN